MARSLTWTLDIVREAGSSIGYAAKVAAIDADIPPSVVAEGRAAGLLAGVVPDQPVGASDAEESTYRRTNGRRALDRKRREEEPTSLLPAAATIPWPRPPSREDSGMRGDCRLC
jgi:hypothetical protein